MYLCMFVVAFCACMVHAQVLHRYVVEVETVPDKREYKAEKLVNGNVQCAAGTTRSEEDGKVLRNPLAHTPDGKAMPGFHPAGQSPSGIQACTEVPAPEERDAGWLGRCQSGGCGTDGVRPQLRRPRPV